MSAVVPPITSIAAVTPGPDGAPAAADNAAAASFAALEAELGYLDQADIEMVRRAYRFADQAHLR